MDLEVGASTCVIVIVIVIVMLTVVSLRRVVEEAEVQIGRIIMDGHFVHEDSVEMGQRRRPSRR